MPKHSTSSQVSAQNSLFKTRGNGWNTKRWSEEDPQAYTSYAEDDSE